MFSAVIAETGVRRFNYWSSMSAAALQNPFLLSYFP
jgi:hypothetical protein